MTTTSMNKSNDNNRHLIESKILYERVRNHLHNILEEKEQKLDMSDKARNRAELCRELLDAYYTPYDAQMLKRRQIEAEPSGS